MKLARLALLAAGGVAIAAFAGVFQPSGARSAPCTVTSSGGITVLGTGPFAPSGSRILRLGTVSQAATAIAALVWVSVGRPRDRGAQESGRDPGGTRQTSDVSLSPRMNDNGGGDRRLHGDANNVTATIKKLGDAGGVVDMAARCEPGLRTEPARVRTRTPPTATRSKKPSRKLQRRRRHSASASSSTLGQMAAIVEGGGSVPMPMALGAAKRAGACRSNVAPRRSRRRSARVRYRLVR